MAIQIFFFIVIVAKKLYVLDVASWEKNKVILVWIENHPVYLKKFAHLPEFRVNETGKNINVVVGEEQGSVIGKNQKAELKKRM